VMDFVNKVLEWMSSTGVVIVETVEELPEIETEPEEGPEEEGYEEEEPEEELGGLEELFGGEEEESEEEEEEAKATESFQARHITDLFG
jgi:ABC-type Zn2+ transport system substrate-binding protein/surface adhesin